MADQIWMSIPLDRLAAMPWALPPGYELGRLRAHEIPEAFGQETLPLIADAFDDRSWDPRVLNNLSNSLADLGRREPALAAIEEAVGIRRRLAEARPDAFLPDLATSLSNLSVHLADLDHQEPALAAVEEAIGIRRGLAEVNPTVFGDALSRSLEVQEWLMGLLPPE